MSTILKQTLCVAAGLGAVSVAAWFLAVRSVSDELAGLKAKASLQQVALAGAPSLADNHQQLIGDLEARIARARAIIADTPGPDLIYDALQEAGKAADVRVERLEPSSTSRRPIDLTKKAGFQAEPTQLDIEVSGEFEAVVSFLTRVERDFGLSKISTVRVQPLAGQTEDGTQVVAQIATAHFTASATDKPKRSDTESQPEPESEPMEAP